MDTEAADTEVDQADGLSQFHPDGAQEAVEADGRRVVAAATAQAAVQAGGKQNPLESSHTPFY